MKMTKQEVDNLKQWLDAFNTRWDHYWNPPLSYVISSPEAKYNPNVIVKNGCPMEKS